MIKKTVYILSLVPYCCELPTIGWPWHDKGAHPSSPKKVECWSQEYEQEQLSVASEGYLTMHKDVCCSVNGKQRAVAGLGLYFGLDHTLNFSEPLKGHPSNSMVEYRLPPLYWSSYWLQGSPKVQCTLNPSSWSTLPAPGWRTGRRKAEWRLIVNQWRKKNFLLWMKLWRVKQSSGWHVWGVMLATTAVRRPTSWPSKEQSTYVL